MRQFIAIVLFVPLMWQCKKQADPFWQITDSTVGVLSRESLARDVDLIYANDSVVRDTTRLNLGNKAKRLKIYEKGGKHLLTLTPSADSIPKIENVRFEDARYRTEKGIGIASTFKDIKEAYTIRKLITSARNVLVLVKESEVYFTISRDELPGNIRYGAGIDVEAVQIPDKANIKYMMLSWD